MNNSDKIQFMATIGKTTNAIDGGYKLSLDISEKDKLAAQALLGLKDKLVSVGMYIIEDEEIGNLT
jgi:hypothetical protein